MMVGPPKISTGKLKLIAFLKDNVGNKENPLDTHSSIRIVRKIFKERGGSLSGMTRKAFLRRAQDIFASRELEKQPFCPICFKTFQSRFFRDLHVKGFHEGKTGNGRLGCDQCDRTFLCRTSLNYHKDIVHSESKHSVSCDICKLTFCHDQTLKRHKESVHQPNDGGSSLKIKCDKCEAQFSRKDSLTRHQRIVHRAFQLEFDEAEKLQTHGKGEYKCRRCGKIFTGPNATWSMKSHLVKKCQDDTVQCSLCAKPFKFKRDLTYHIKIKHSADVQSFSCTLCDFTSQYEKSLIRHKKRKHSSGTL